MVPLHMVELLLVLTDYVASLEKKKTLEILLLFQKIIKDEML